MKKSELNIETIILKKLLGERINWHEISSICYKAETDFFDEFKEQIHWDLALRKIFTEEKLIHIVPYIERNKEAWNSLAFNQKLSTNFMETYWKELHKKAISKYQILEEDFILKHIRELDWELLALHQNLTPPVIDIIRTKIKAIDSILLYRKMHDDLMAIIVQTKANIGKISQYSITNILEVDMQREIIRKLKEVMRKIK